jgi:hypothetical protein
VIVRSNSTLIFETGGATERARFNSTGNLAFVSGKGIDFSAVTGGTGTATANVLNDYEEGTWTGTLKGGTTDPTTPVAVNGVYTKIGRLVNVSIAFESVTTTGASGAISITGLPFTISGLRQQGTAGSLSAATFTGYMIATATVSGTAIELFSVNSASGWTAATHNAGTARFLWVNLAYIA